MDSLKQGPVAAALAANAVSERKRFFLPVEAELPELTIDAACEWSR